MDNWEYDNKFFISATLKIKSVMFMKKLKILLITQDYPPPMGGMQIFTYNLEQELKKYGHDVRVLNFDGRNKNNYKDLKIIDLFYTHATRNKYYSLFKLLNPLFLFKSGGYRDFVFDNMIYRMSKIEIADYKPDIIHLLKATLYTSIYDLNDKTPIIVSCYATEIKDLYPVKYTLNKVNIIHCITAYTSNLVQAITPRVSYKIRVINPPIDLTPYYVNNSSKRKKQLITVCRLVKRKNIETVIKAYALLSENIKNDYKYVIVGAGPELNTLNKLVKKLKLQYNVIFTGIVNQEQKIKLLMESMIFVMCPRSYKNQNEGFGISFLEAQAAGLPVIGSNNGGIFEAVGNGGILVENEMDSEEIAEKIQLVLNDELLYKKLVNNCKLRIKKFNLDKWLRDIVNIYRSIL